MRAPVDDPVLSSIRQLRVSQAAADERMRVLLAFAREVARPYPYRLSDLAEASGLSISGVRQAYSAADVVEAGRVPASALMAVDEEWSWVREQVSR